MRHQLKTNPLPRCQRTNTTRRRRLAAAALAALTLWLTPVSDARAGSVATLSPEQVLFNSDIIFEGVVTSATPRWTDAAQRNIVTDYVFRLDRVLRDDKGTLAARIANRSVTLTFAGGEIGDRAVDVHGVPSFALNERVFLCVSSGNLGTLAPTLGLWQGVYRVRNGAVNGVAAEHITHTTACCGAETTVDQSFFGKTIDHAGGFTAAEFAAELARAIPIARQKAELALPAPRGGPMGTGVRTVDDNPVLDFARFRNSPGPSADLHRVANEETRAPAPGIDPSQPIMPPAPPANPFFIEGGPVDGSSPSTPRNDRYGFTRAVPNVPWVFNVPPGMGAFAGQFENQLAYWNGYASDVFRVYANPNNQIGGGNGRNETAFLSGAAMDGQYHQGGWDPNTYAVCYNYSQNNRIVESDIVFNVNLTWTTDYTQGFNSGSSGSVIYFAPVALHEQGHAFGLAHSWVFNPGYGFPSIMNYFPYNLEAEVRHVYADDAAGIRAAYPARIVNINDFGVYLWANTGAQAAGDPPNNLTAWSTFPAAVTAGNNFTLSNFFLENVGTIAGSPTVEFYLTPNRQSFDGAIYCGSLAFGNFNSFAGGRYNATLSVPNWTPPANYYVAAYKQNGDSYGANNSAWSNTRILVNPVPPPPRPGNDNFLNAYTLSLGSTSGTTVNATNDGSGSCGLSENSPDVWYRVYVSYNGVLDIDTCGSSLDTVVSLWLNSPFVINPELVCNDDAGLSCSNRASHVQRTVVAGSTTWVRVAGFNNTTGTFVLNVHFIASNDLCSNAVPITTGTYYGYTAGSGAESSIGSCGSSGTTPDIWYTYTASCPGSVHLDTFGSSYDTVLSVKPNCGDLTIIACNDDCTAVGPSCLDFTVVPGETYKVRLSGYNGATGAAVLNVIANNISPNDECFTATPVGDGATTVYTNCATDSDLAMPDGCATTPGVNMYHDVWYTYTPASDSTVAIALCTGAFSPALAVYDNACPTLPEEAIACGAAEADCNTPLLSFTGLADHTYLIRVGSAEYGGIGIGEGQLTLNIIVAPLPVGACCMADGSCLVRSQAGCTETYNGDDSVCEEANCPILFGACCASDGTCTISTVALCIGDFQGGASVCEEVVCPILLGGCCAADLTCTITLASECVGDFNGGGTVCENIECIAPSGACCGGTVCSIATADDCAAALGSFQGVSTTCDFPGNPVTCCRANYNQQNGVSVQDIFDFLAGYFSNAPAADVNDSGTVSVQDIFDYLALYFSGCS